MHRTAVVCLSTRDRHVAISVVSGQAPYRWFNKANVVNRALRKAFEKTGSKPPQKNVGSCVFTQYGRRSLMLENGQPLEVGHLLPINDFHRHDEVLIVVTRNRFTEFCFVIQEMVTDAFCSRRTAPESGFQPTLPAP